MSEGQKRRLSAYLVWVGVFLAAVGLALAGGYFLGRRTSSPASGMKSEDTGLKVVVLGVDGAEWNILNRLMAEGRLPNISRLVKEGARGKLLSIKPLLSPIIWTSIATGKTPDKHGIGYFLVKDPEHSRAFPVQSTMRQCKAIWNILTEQNRTAGVIGWWASYPAETVNGFVVTDYLAYHAFGLSGKKVKESLGKTYPASLYDQVAPAFQDPLRFPKATLDRFMPLTDEEYNFSVNREFDFGNPLHHFMYALSTGMAYREIGLTLYQQYRPDWMGIYFEQVDSLSHLFMKYTEPKMEGMSDEQFQKFKEVVPNYYVYQDEIIGDFLAALDPNTVVVICSDHGFKTGDKRLTENVVTSVAKAHLWHELYGVVILWGGPIKKGVEIEGASVVDITPTMLYLLGLPVARDMDGKILLDAIDEKFQEKHPPRFIDTYEKTAPAAPQAEAPVAQDQEVDKQVLAKLEALGYIGSGLEDTEVRQNRIRAHVDKGDFTKALVEADAMLAQKPDDARALFTKAQLLEQAGRGAEAEPVYRQLAAKAGKNVNPQEKMLYAQALKSLAVFDHLAGKSDEAIKELKQSLELMPRNYETYYNLGVIHESRSEYLEAIEAYQKAIEIRPNHALSHNNLGNCYQKVGEIQKAIAEYKRTAEIDPSHVECHFNLGVLYFSLGQLQDANNEFEKAIEINSSFTPAIMALSDLSIQTGDYPKAKQLLTGLLATEQKNPQVLYLLAKVELLLGAPDQAREHINAAREIDPDGINQAIMMDPALKSLAEPGRK